MSEPRIRNGTAPDGRTGGELRYEVVVVGGGPAGSSAAYHLARRDVQVIVLDKSEFPREKVCGEGLTPRATRSLYGMGLDQLFSDKYSRIEGVAVCGSYPREVRCRFPATPGFPDHGYVVPREELDRILLEKAEEAGARVLTGYHVLGPLVENGRVVGVRATHEGREVEVEAGAVIGADGARSTLGKSLDLLVQDDRYIGVSIRQHYAGVEGLSNMLEVHPDGKILPCCGWIFPLGKGLANVGVGGMLSRVSRKGINLKDILSSFLRETRHAARKLRGAEPCGPLRGGILRVGLGGSRVERPGLILVGDAASVGNPVSGEGISYALETGQMAADTILTRKDETGRIGHDPGEDSFRKKLVDRYGHYFQWGLRSIRWGTNDFFMVPLMFTVDHNRRFRDWLVRALMYMRH